MRTEAKREVADLLGPGAAAEGARGAHRSVVARGWALLEEPQRGIVDELTPTSATRNVEKTMAHCRRRCPLHSWRRALYRGRSGRNQTPGRDYKLASANY
jgi:hypothetical protein